MNARPTIYNGIQMRSRLEARWAAAWDRAGITWTYEPGAFASTAGQYLPDFRFDFPRRYGSKVVYVELKGNITDLAQLDRYLRRMSIIWSSEPEALLLLIEDEAQRCWMGRVDEDGSEHWCEHDGDVESLLTGQGAA